MTLSILYVDDEPDLLEIATFALELDPEIELRTCESGPVALAMLKRWKPDLLLLDMMMPGMDGPSVHVAARDLCSGAMPAVVYITARAERAEIARLMGLGASGVIAKPFDPMSLAAQLREFAGHG